MFILNTIRHIINTTFILYLRKHPGCNYLHLQLVGSSTRGTNNKGRPFIFNFSGQEDVHIGIGSIDKV